MTSLLESGIPIEAVNEYSEVEKGPGRPPHWEMVFWWTRKPLAGARAIIAASLLPADAYSNPEQFLNDLFPCRHERKTVHHCNPSPRLVERLRGKKVLDPFAGFGSIPLEAARLGADAAAVELLPTAYVFLKAVLEYPKKFGRLTAEVAGREAKELGLEDAVKKFNGVKAVADSARYKVPMLIYDVARWGRWVLEQLRNDPDVAGLYDADVYIGTWEVKCPVCGRYTPLVGNWWLARVKDGTQYKRLAWMKWEGGRASIMDLNDECRRQGGINCGELNAKVQTKEEEGEGGSVEWRGQRYTVPAKNIDARNETAQCLYCRAEINHRVVNGKITKGGRRDGDWYVKWALRQWNELYEKYLRGEIALEDLKNAPARPTLLAKVYIKDGDLQFQSAAQQDIDKLWQAAEKLKQMWGDPDTPIEVFAPYQMGSAGAFRITLWGFDKFFKLFNSRQLLTLAKLVKLIREAGKKIEEEKLKDGWSKGEALDYSEATVVYLSIALVRYADYNAVITFWNYGGQLPAQVAHGLSMRGIAMSWNYGDVSPFVEMSGTGTFLSNLNKLYKKIIPYLITISSDNSKAKVLLDDASELYRLGGEKFDLIVTDPPYADDVPYSELSDFYFVWLKRALSDSDGTTLRPRFLPEAFFDELGLEVRTQWEQFAVREVSESEGRREYFKVDTTFRDMLAKAFANVLRFLKEDGLLVTYYVAKKPESWVALVDALWRVNGLEMVAAYPVATESEENVVARGKASVLGGYVSAWRRRSGPRPLDLSAERERIIEEVARRVDRRLKVVSSGTSKKKNGMTTWVYAYLAALEYLTAHSPVTLGGLELDSEGLMRQAVAIAFEALLRKAGVRLSDPAAHAYLALRIMESEKGYVDSDTLSHVERATGLPHVDLVKLGLIREADVGGPRVAKRKAFEVLAPRRDTVDEIRRVYSAQRGRPALDCLRQLQLNLLAKTSVACAPEVREEALALARALVELARAGVLDEDDVDVKTARVILGAEWWG
ncbi:putative DNA methylase [Thermoproteus uzoniensis 768-20]|uniref:DNA methylase n=1 Tax=Thermoproteus uzoniensis (strain 768-20) TaxID=999630 RepID=F2L353_THEU7|nr:DUF1156 domain-containing protein [Thermoproteus uzoniensis]AEA13172.1 putative DNA methylase [Thermoproteus uzoniensis 768-20]